MTSRKIGIFYHPSLSRTYPYKLYTSVTKMLIPSFPRCVTSFMNVFKLKIGSVDVNVTTTNMVKAQFILLRCVQNTGFE